MVETDSSDMVDKGNGGEAILVSSERPEEGEGDGPIRYITELTAEEILEMEFRSLEEACEFYERYAWFHGFVVRKHVRDKDGDGNIVMRQLVCNRAGLRDKKHSNRVDRVRKERDATRTNCEAKIRFHFDKRKQKWVVASFVGTHNHGMTPGRQMHLHPKFRGLKEADRAQVESMALYGVKTCQIMNYMLGQKGGHASLGFGKKELYNFVHKLNSSKIEKGDGSATLGYFKSKEENDEYHYMIYTEDEQGHIANVFWADGICRSDYKCFGDVLAFDSTYRRNKYNLPVVIFSGANNHGETVVFGCAVLTEETTETYKWLLTVFLHAMYGKTPCAVVTDGDVAMRDAIKEVFPEAWHRLCAWHLEKNALAKVKNKRFLTVFSRALYEDLTRAEFEEMWEEMLNETGLGENDWVKNVYGRKKMWCSAYMRDNFFAGIRTTSRCEGINNFINQYVKRTDCLLQFVVNYERAVKEYRHNELVSEFKTNMSFPIISTALSGLEECAARTYTRKIFVEVKAEITDAGAHFLDETVVQGDTMTMKVIKSGKPLGGRVVTFDRAYNKFSCQCRLYESRGIPCAHIFCVLKQWHMTTIPSSLILKRWTVDAKSEQNAYVTEEDGDAHNGTMLRFAALSAECNMMCKVAAKNTDDFIELKKQISRLAEDLLKRVEERSKHRAGEKIVGDPCFVKSKGAPGKGKAKNILRKKRKCSGCGKRGHYISTCPKLTSSEVECSRNDNNCSSSDAFESGGEETEDRMVGGDPSGAEDQNGIGYGEPMLWRGESSERIARHSSKRPREVEELGQRLDGGRAGMETGERSSSLFDMSSSAMELLNRVQDPNWGNPEK